MNSIIERADAIAADAHAGQTRRHGAAYIDHPRAVAQLAQDLAGFVGVAFDDDDVAGALLHDVIEDCERYDENRLRVEVSARAAAHAAVLTKTGKGDDATAAYYAAIAAAPVATRVIKVADRLHNLSELHKAHNPAKLSSYVDETRRFVRPLADSFDGVADVVRAVVDDAIACALRVGAHHDGQAQAAFGRDAAGLYVIVGPGGADDELRRRVDAMCRGGAVRVQVRAKGAAVSDGVFFERASSVVDVCEEYGVDVVVNDRADVAFGAAVDHAGLAGFVGVHVGDGDVPPRVARRLLGADALVGTSTHSLAQLQAMAQEGSACHLALGPIWSSYTKQGHADVVGVETLASAASLKLGRPLVAIGGITTPARAFEAARAGADLVAVVSAVDLDDVDAISLMCRRLALACAAGRASRST